MANKYMEKMLSITNCNKNGIKLRMRYHLTPISIVTIKRIENNKYLEGCREIGTLVHCW